MASWYTTETTHPAFDNKPTPLISFGQPFQEICLKQVQYRFKSSRVFIIASRSLSKNTSYVEDLKSALGDRIADVHIGISPHTPILEIVDILAEVKPLNIDCIVTLGAGSITDGAKLVRFAIANDTWTEEEVGTLWGGKSHNPHKREDLHKPTIPLICIPTSLSGGEYQAIAGATDSKSKAKHTFEPNVDPDLVIQDPQLTTTTPQKIWLSTGIRSVDHCVETLCSLQSNDDGDAWAARGLEKLISGLLRCKHDPQDLDARHLCQTGVVEAMRAVSSGVPLGASHAIGHQLGPLNVGHGETSCILLPAVCKFNARKNANNDHQKRTVDILLKQDTVQSLLAEKKVSEEDVDLGDILDLIIRELEMPRTLKDVGVTSEHFPGLAENSLNDIWIKTNAYAITKTDEVMEILEAVAGN
ncbi:related to Fe-containing alcohol dehydrogenase [Fusarium oxysporum]|uniref:Related to Fe-containing alcohol dehydrogenase n=1 Tax=Fusarium oxysporum TaxID=5507 RepID=A0A2H3TP09_FUSOX|nr:related to Fe-containing alcohol dehydrogenase [Fusarium oxysporum]